MGVDHLRIATGVAVIVVVVTAALLYWGRSGEERENAAENRAETNGDGEWVVLLHGIFRGPRSMAKIEKALVKADIGCSISVTRAHGNPSKISRSCSIRRSKGCPVETDGSIS